MDTVTLYRAAERSGLKRGSALRYRHVYLQFLTAAILNWSLHVSPAVAAGVPPPSVPEVLTPKLSHRVTIKPSVGLHMGRVELVFEKTTLDEMLRQVGSGVMHRQGNAGEAIGWLCYTVHPLKERLWIIASAEMGGPEQRITEISASYEISGPAQDCPELPNRLLPLSLDNGIWLGMAPDDARKVFAVDASLATGDWDTFEFESHTPAAAQDTSMCASTGYDVENWLVLKQQDRRIVELHAGQTTTC
jgi:hypothetical protein